MAPATFYFDLGSPYAYLTAERLDGLLPGPVQWQPVSLGALFKLCDRGSWSLQGPEVRASGIEEVQSRARLYGLPPVRWPEPWPGNYLTAMRAATFAYRAGRGREFTLQAFRDAFQRGRDLSQTENVLDTARAAGLDPVEVQAACQDSEIKLALREATEDAHRRGVFGVPTLRVAGEVFWGDDRVEEAAARAGESG